MTRTSTMASGSGYHIPAWKRELLQRKATNEKIKKAADQRLIRDALIAGSRLHNEQTPLNFKFVETAEREPVWKNTPRAFTHVAREDKDDVAQKAASHSPNPFTYPRVRISRSDDAAVVEEAVVKVKENPFKEFEREHLNSPTIAAARDPMLTAVRHPKRVSFPTYVSGSNRGVSASDSDLLASPRDSITSETMPRHSKKYIEFSPRVTPQPIRYSRPNSEISQRMISHAAHDSTDGRRQSRSRIAVSTSVSSKVRPREGSGYTQPLATESRSFLVRPYSAQHPPPHLESHNVEEELPAPNTVSNLKSVYESRSQRVAPVRPFRVRAKTPPPPEFRKSLPVNVVNQNQGFNQRRDIQRPTATVRPVIHMEKPEPSSVQPMNMRSRKGVEILLFVPSFVHEYTSDRTTSLLNTLIRDSPTYKLLPSAVYDASHRAHQSRNESTKTPNAFQMMPAASTKDQNAGNTSKSSFLFRNEASNVPDRTVASTRHSAVDYSTPDVVLIEKEPFDASSQLFEVPKEPTPDNRAAGQPPSRIYQDDPAHPKVLVFQQSAFKQPGVHFSTAQPTATALVRDDVPRMVVKADEPLHVECVELNAVASFSDSSGARSPTQVSTNSSNSSVTVVAEPPPENLRSCIAQTRKTSGLGARNISFCEEVYVHEYPVVFWTSEEELNHQSAAGSFSVGESDAGDEDDGAPLADVDDEFDLFSPAGSNQDVSNLPPSSTRSEIASYRKRVLQSSSNQSDLNNNSARNATIQQLSGPPATASPQPPVHMQPASSLDDLIAIDDDDDHKPASQPSRRTGARMEAAMIF